MSLSDARREEMGGRPLLLAAVTVAVALGLFSAGQGYFFRIAENEPATLGPLLLASLPAWLFWAIAAPLVFRLAHRFPLDRDRWRRSLGLHVAFGVLLAVPYAAVTVFTGRLAFPTEIGFGPLLLRSLPGRIQLGLIIYFAVVGVAHAMEYHRGLREREVEASRLSAQLAQAQLQALKMQLHPHFLFNTLHAIGVLIREDPTAAGRMLTLLGDLLRHTLAAAGTQEVPLRQELEFLQSYLEIERLRFPDRLSIDFDVPAELLGTPVPHFILQPLVENAVRYGISPRSEPGRIEIRAARAAEGVEIEVWNDGATLPANGGAPREGIGLATTRVRLAKMYGESGQLALRNAARGGVSVTLCVPGDGARG